jgi:SAM-dependent methyltransferase
MASKSSAVALRIIAAVSHGVPRGPAVFLEGCRRGPRAAVFAGSASEDRIGQAVRMEPDATTTWRDAEKVDEYVERVGRLAARAAGEAELVEALPERVDRVLDLGCGDGRLIALVLGARPDASAALGLDTSPPMIERARERFAGDPRVRIEHHDLREAIPDDGPFDAVVSGFAIHHVAHDRKRSLVAEVVARLRPGGVFANLEVVQCATPALQEEFYRRIGRPGGDPEDVLAGVEEQLDWMRAAGLEDVDCSWRWRGFALLAGRAA